MLAVEWLKPIEVAQELGMSVRAVHLFVKRGELPATRFGRFVKISRADVDAYIAAHRIDPGTIGYLLEP